jgi:hypothetical protein
MRARGVPANILSKLSLSVLMRRSMSSPSSVRMQTWLEVLWRSMPIKFMAGLDSFLRSSAAKCSEHYVTTRRGDQPLHPIPLCPLHDTRWSDSTL